jgi:succinate dehydrogenase / fumarate reductase iron-sulfur subunit
MGAGGCSKRVAEFTGPGVRSLPMDARTTVCNMAVEMSARTGIMAYDDVVADFLKGRAQWPVEPIDSDPDADYAQVVNIDLSALEPIVAFPHKPANTTPISRLQEMIARSQREPTPAISQGRGQSRSISLAHAAALAVTQAPAQAYNPLFLYGETGRQASAVDRGRLENYSAEHVSPDMSFLEMLDVVNEGLIRRGEDAIAFESDCREGICGSCGLVVNGIPHGPDRGTTVCQLHMRRFKNGDTITIEPWRARAFPIIKDLVVDRSAFDRIIAAGGYVSVNAGGAQDGNSILIPKDVSEAAMDSAACIGCGACVAACKNASAHLFMSAKISHLALLPQGQQERYQRVTAMIAQADSEGFGSCSNEGECEAVCPKEIPISNIARMTREYMRATLAGK